MKISDDGLRLIKSFEGYQKRLANGDCTAYQDTFRNKKTGNAHVDVPTIGYGCTEGVVIGMVWSEKQAEMALRRELAKHEAAVTAMVTLANLNQNEFDALVSLSYNVGAGAVAKSRLLKALNAGDRIEASNCFLPFSRAGGVVVDGLVSRRMREAALFLKPVAAPSEPYMPQTVDEPKRPLSTHEKVLAGAAAGGAALETAKGVIGQAQDVKSVTSDAFSLIPAGLPVSWIVGGLFGALLLSGVALIVSHLRSK
jgi:lysozyme